ncbi:putative Trehalose-phosphatase [Candidatus Sulfopaludibacter sp. SbA4]|nr:putative Trehalose-phosphatase [Candidatus Sulfopaludibacter sp. SbA4]
MLHLFDGWQQVAERVRAAGSVALFLDFDGTLAVFAARPEDARLGHETRNALARLAIDPRMHVSIVSGRRRADIQTRVGLARVQYLGLHGWENGSTPRLRPEVQSSLDGARRWLAARVQAMPGIRIEDKGAGFSVHYRGAPDGSVSEARSAVGVAVASAVKLRAIPGGLSWEILPRDIGDKGTAVRHQLSLLPGHALAMYAGDDRTDEPAFAALPDGITVRVGRRALTRAQFQLRDPGEVRRFLERLRGAF